MNWFAVFLYLWAAGTSAALALVPAQDLGRRFFRFNTALLLLFAVVATAIARPFFDGFSGGTLPLLANAIAWALVADIVVIATLVFSRTRPIVPVAFLLPVITGAFLATVIALGRNAGAYGDAALLTLHLITSGALLGAVLVAMNLGHSYLQNAALSFDHLTRLAKLFLWAGLVKLVLSLVLIAPRAEEAWAKMGDEFDWMLVLVRVGVALVFYPAFGFMTLSCAKSRANQSATGILYAAVVVVLVGEAISLYLTLDRGIRV